MSISLACLGHFSDFCQSALEPVISCLIRAGSVWPGGPGGSGGPSGPGGPGGPVGLVGLVGMSN